jgi:hypothetical protein
VDKYGGLHRRPGAAAISYSNIRLSITSCCTVVKLSTESGDKRRGRDMRCKRIRDADHRRRSVHARSELKQIAVDLVNGPIAEPYSIRRDIRSSARSFGLWYMAWLALGSNIAQGYLTDEAEREHACRGAVLLHCMSPDM